MGSLVVISQAILISDHIINLSVQLFRLQKLFVYNKIHLVTETNNFHMIYYLYIAHEKKNHSVTVKLQNGICQTLKQ